MHIIFAMLARLVVLSLLSMILPLAHGQASSGPSKGTLVVDGGGGTDLVKAKFMAIAGGPGARVVVIPSGASSIRFGPDKIILNPDSPRDSAEWIAYEKYLRSWLGTEHVTVLHTRNRDVASSEDFMRPLQAATGVFVAAGNAGRIADSYLGTRTQQALQDVLDRGGVIFGSSAGAIILGSFIVRGFPAKPVLMAPGHDRGFAFIKNVAIDPHLTESKRDYELINVVDAYPNLLGIGIDEGAALVVKANQFEVIGTGRVAIYDNQPHNGGWYYWLNAGDRFDLGARRKVDQGSEKR